MQGPPLSVHVFWKKETLAHLKPRDQRINPSMRRFVTLLPRDGMVKHGMRMHNKESLSRTAVDMYERTMKSVLVQWVSTWCKETRTTQQIMMSWEMVLREVPIPASVDTMPEAPRVILLGPPKRDAPAIFFS